MENIKRKKKRINRQRRNVIVMFLIITAIIISTNAGLKPNCQTILNEGKSQITAGNAKQVNTNDYLVFPNKVFGVPVYTELIDVNTEARPGTKRTIKYIVIHETDNYEVGVGAANHAKFLKENNDSATSWHYTVDSKEIYHHVPDNEIAYHAGDKTGNQYGIGIELCVNKDGNFEKTFDNAAKLVAYLMKEYNLTIDDVKTHHDFSGKDCPHTILKYNRMGEFKKKVQKYYDNNK